MAEDRPGLVERRLNSRDDEGYREQAKNRVLGWAARLKTGAITPEQFAEDLADREARLVADAIRDPLTKLYSRAFIGATIDRELEFGKVTNKKTGLVFVDVDKFKLVNDTYGHEVGDNVLRALGGMLKKREEQSENRVLGGRWGGEEFVVVTQSENEADLRELGVSLGMEIREGLHKAAGLDSPITASVGVVEVKAGESAREALGRADGLMYMAKQSGRDQMVVEKNDGSREVVKFGEQA